MPNGSELLALGQYLQTQGRGLDTSGLGALMGQEGRYWPQSGRAFSEIPGQLLPPAELQENGFVGPGFVGPMPPVQNRVLPNRRDVGRNNYQGRGNFGRIMDPMSPVSDDEYRLLINQLVEGASRT